MEKQDRRVIRTRSLLRGALMELILEKGYESITIQDITRPGQPGPGHFLYALHRQRRPAADQHAGWLPGAGRTDDGIHSTPDHPFPLRIVFDYARRTVTCFWSFCTGPER